MNSIKTGKIVSDLRKSKGWTQLELAEKLFVSDRTISKWESGAGFPEITQLPQLAKVFDVSIDYLLTGKGEVSKSLIDRLEECAINDDVVLFNQLKEQDLLGVKDKNGKTLTDYVKMHRSKELFGLLLEEKDIRIKKEAEHKEAQNVSSSNRFDYSNVNQNYVYSGAVNSARAEKTKLIKPIVFLLLAGAFFGLITYFTRMVTESVDIPFFGVVSSSFSLMDLLGSSNGFSVFMSVLFLISLLAQVVNTVILLAIPNVEEKKYAIAYKIISVSTFGVLVIASAMFLSRLNHYYPILLLIVNLSMLVLSLINLVAKYDENVDRQPKYYIKHSKVLEILSIMFVSVFIFLSLGVALTLFSKAADAGKILIIASMFVMSATFIYNIVSLVTKKVFAWGVAFKGLNIFAMILIYIAASNPDSVVTDSSSTGYSTPDGILLIMLGFLLANVIINLMGILRIKKREQ